MMVREHEPTEVQASDLPAVISDDGGQWNRIPITQQQVEVLKAKGLIYYCGYCTQIGIQIGVDGGNESEPDEYSAREYHTREALCDMDDPQAYLDSLLIASKEESA